MAKAKKLPSGQWRTLVYSHTDPDGKRKYESFTADTKKESEYLAAEFALNKKERTKGNLTFKEAREKYISLKSNVLSPSTLRGYKQMNTYFEKLDDLRLSSINQKLVQEWINSFSSTHAPKTVHNAYGFMCSVVKSNNPNFNISVTLPKKVKVKYYTPPDTDITKIVSYLQESDTELLKAVCLSAFGTLRRSEICGLYRSDVKGNIIHVCKSVIVDKDNICQLNNKTKTEDSDRYVELPYFVVDLFPKEGKLVNLTPDVITRRFFRTLKKLNMQHFRFHDLRHYSASIMHALGIPDQYIMERGGWSSDRVLKEVYRGTMDDFSKHYTDVTNNHFSKICNTKYNTKNKNP